jgi:hypothetical protein
MARGCGPVAAGFEAFLRRLADAALDSAGDPFDPATRG